MIWLFKSYGKIPAKGKGEMEVYFVENVVRLRKIGL
ncbi:MAG: hypothetical protein ACJAYA_001085 [Bacteroidia bacterium]|jgi:hypothetical protein